MNARIEEVVAQARRRARRRELRVWLVLGPAAALGGVALSPFRWVETVGAIVTACLLVVGIVLFVLYIRAAANEDLW